MKRTILSLLLVNALYTFACSQIIKPVKWTFSTKKVNEDMVDLIFTARINSPWHMYGLHIEEGGPIPTSIHFDNTTGFSIIGKPKQFPKPEIVDDKIFNMRLELHSGQVSFTQRIKKIQTDSIIILGSLEYMTCSDMQCVLGENDFSFRLKGREAPEPAAPSLSASAAPEVDSAVLVKSPVPVMDKQEKKPDAAKKSLLGVLLLAMLAGLGGLLTPCVYPMIPMTVSYFLRGSKSRGRAISEALVFGLSIIVLYTMIGVLVAVFKNPNAVNNFTTHWITNLVFFLIFIFLAASFLGMFELILPSGIANRVDRQADRGGYLGAFFMALAMAILSFSCTGPIVASLLIRASQGEVLEPVIGMAGFSVVFALPFTLFAIFPSWLKGLPKSGGWLNAVKVFFAFIMLAFSLYFLSKIDQSYHLNLISRYLFLSIWVVIFVLLGLYLLGRIRFPHDSDIQLLSVPRFMLALASLSFALFLFTGFLGNDLKGLSTILPPKKEPAFAVEPVTGLTTGKNPVSAVNLCGYPKYADFLSLPNGLNGYFDYEEALACAREKNKPVLVDFVGHTCSNCKKMYSKVWSDPRVLDLLRNEFIIVALYTDDRTKLPENEWITSKQDGKVKNTIGKKNQDLQVERFNSNALPLFAIVGPDGNDRTEKYYTYDPSVDKFLNWLREGLK
jgi:thiol:disulfide interchange protein DsbD